MGFSEEELRRFSKRLFLARMRILATHGFYGLLLMHLSFSLDEESETAYTDGDKIAFNPHFLSSLNDNELDFILMHEVLHVALQHCFRGMDLDQDLFNVACDVVVNSTILKENGMDLDSISILGREPSMHLAPNGKEGYEFTAEEIYAMLQETHVRAFQQSEDAHSRQKENDSSDESLLGDWETKEKPDEREPKSETVESIVDDHSKWGKGDENGEKRDEWAKRVVEAASALSEDELGALPGGLKRTFHELKDPQLDWKVVLNSFIQEETVDYSFFPPDHRFDDGPFFLPSWSEKEDCVKDVLFMVDVSGSIEGKELDAAFSEIKGAIDQFNGKLKGWIGFFDAKVNPPKPFEDVNDILKVEPIGGGGTSFSNVFSFLKKQSEIENISTIIILTDGYCDFPKEEEANGIPVLWLLNNDRVEPPWGKAARIKA